MAYSEHDRAAALAALETNNGNLTRTAKQLGMSDRTLRRWRDEHNNPGETASLKTATTAALPAARASIAQRLQDFIHQALDIAPDKLNDASLQHLFVAIGVSVDKAQLLEGRPTNIGEVRDALSDDERAARVAALLDAARARRAGHAPPN